MRLLLDTHTFIWWDSEPGKLSSKALALCQDRSNTILLSVASVWEMQIKSQLGKLKLKSPLRKVVEGQCKTNGLEVPPVGLEHVLALDALPTLHKDPFDRQLIAQANTENAILLSNDPLFQQYPVRVVW